MSKVELTEVESGLATKEAKPQVTRPPMYKVTLLNDDFTPMDFVVKILKNYFAMNEVKAVQVMLEVHTKGKGLCGIFTRDIAETKVIVVNDYAKSFNYPLLCSMEPE